MKYANVFYFHKLNSIGGIETFFYQLGKKYGKDFDITVFYRQADAEQVRRLSQYVRVRKYRDGTIIRCHRMFVCFNVDILQYVEADEYYQMLHGDYVSIGYYPDTHPKIQKYISVSETVRDAYQKGKGEDSIVSYNPFTPVKPVKVLNLVSATRMTPDKGYERMEILAKALENSGVKFTWQVFTDTERPIMSQNIILRRPRLDVIDFIADADYFVQLSDAEGYCYSVVEALSVGTPVIVTDFKVIHELGVEHGVNGFILPMDMSEIPVSGIKRGLKKFSYTPLEDKWGELLVKAKSDGVDDKSEVTVRATQFYYDLQRQENIGIGTEFECDRNRALYLEDLGLVTVLE